MPTFPTAGIAQRAKPRLQFVKGYDGQQAAKFAENLPVTPNVAVYSGQVVSKLYSTDRSRYEWALGLVSGGTPFVAEKDYDDADVQAAGNLQAFPLDSVIEFRTGWVVPGTLSAWSDDVRLTAVAQGQTNAGSLAVATSGDPVVGIVSGGLYQGLLDVASENTNVVRDGNGQVLVAQLRSAFNRGATV
jgi:hypothetical protein